MKNHIAEYILSIKRCAWVCYVTTIATTLSERNPEETDLSLLLNTKRRLALGRSLVVQQIVCELLMPTPALQHI